MQHAPQPERTQPAAEAQATQPGVSQAGATEAMAAAPARRRFGAIQIVICLLFFVEGLLGLFIVGWPALSLCILGALYMAKVARREDAQPGRSKA